MVPARIGKAPGRKWGKRVTTNIPEIAGGNGALTDFKVHVERKWRFRGRKRSYLLARCPTGRLLARGNALFEDGRNLRVGVVRRCRGI